MGDAGQLQAGWCAAQVAGELPGLGLLSCGLAAPAGLLEPSPQHLRERLRELSNRMRGSSAIALRNEPVAAAQRVFFRQIGLDPDLRRTPIEAVGLQRMVDGGHRSVSLLADALLIALLDTRVAVWALDAEGIRGELGLRASADGEGLGDGAAASAPLPAGTLVVADEARPLASLFGEVSSSHRPYEGTTALRLFALRVPGVPALFAEEALWSVHGQLAALA